MAKNDKKRVKTSKLATAVCEADVARIGDFANLTVSQASDAIAGLADVYLANPELFTEEFFGRHVPLAVRRARTSTRHKARS